MNAQAVAIRDLLVLDRRGRVILQVPEFTLAHGEVCAVYGASSAGSNVFLNCVSGLCDPTEGSVRIYGHPRDTVHRKMHPPGVLPREGGVFPDFSTAENLGFALRFSDRTRRSHAERTRQRERVCSLLSLESYMRTPAKQLPAGLRQRLGVACALIHDPYLLVADDPWGSADIDSRRLITRALQDHCDRGRTLLFASPREAEITSLASEICLFNRTTLVARGTLEHLRRYVDTQETIVVQLQDRASLFAERVSSLAGMEQCEVSDRTVTIQASPGAIRLTRLSEHVQALGLELLDMHVRRHGLSDLYAAVVGQGVTE